MKKITTIILILTVLLMPRFAFAAADSWDLTLPENLTEIGASAFAEDTSLGRVYVGDMVETIGAQAFADSSLRDIRLPASLTAVAPDAFQNVPHVEVYGSWNPEFFAGMDNVSMSGAVLASNASTHVPVAAGQELFRRIPITMTGTWYIAAENCSSAALYTMAGEKIEDLEFGTSAFFTSCTLTENEEVLLCIRNDTDSLIDAEVYIESPFNVSSNLCKYQAEYKGTASLLQLLRADVPISLAELEAHQYYAPVLRVTANGTDVPYALDAYVDDILVRSWKGTLNTTAAPEYFQLDPEEVMKFGGFDAGEHSVRIEGNNSVIEYTYTLTGARKPQSIGPEASSLYILPEQHVFATFTADSDGLFTIQSDIPKAMQIYARLIDEDGNVLDSKEDDSEGYDFYLSANLAAEQTVTLEVWLPSQIEKLRPFYGVVPLIVGRPHTEGTDIFKDAQCRALVIGETYETAPEYLTRLDGCKNDADCMAAMLSGLAGSPYQVTEQLNLSAADILAAIPAAFADATENDVSLFYYSGHGATGSGALVGNDGGGVLPTTLRAALDQVPGTKIVLLDSCFSGYFIGRGSDDAAEAAAALEQFMSAFSYTSHGAGNEYFVLTASSLYETSIGYKGTCSLFTRSLLEGMGFDPENNAARTGSSPADANQDGMFALNELYVYTYNEVHSGKLGQTVCPWPYNCNQVLFIDAVPEQ